MHALWCNFYYNIYQLHNSKSTTAQWSKKHNLQLWQKVQLHNNPKTTLPEKMSSSPVLGGVGVVEFIVFCVMFCGLFVCVFVFIKYIFSLLMSVPWYLLGVIRYVHDINNKLLIWHQLSKGVYLFTIFIGTIYWVDKPDQVDEEFESTMDLTLTKNLLN